MRESNARKARKKSTSKQQTTAIAGIEGTQRIQGKCDERRELYVEQTEIRVEQAGLKGRSTICNEYQREQRKSELRSWGRMVIPTQKASKCERVSNASRGD
jgi:hypothetical protein